MFAEYRSSVPVANATPWWVFSLVFPLILIMAILFCCTFPLYLILVHRFLVLKDYNEYLIWNKEFTAECKVQKLGNMIDKEYRSDEITDPFEKTLYYEKCIYFFSVLLRSLQKPYGLDCMRERMEDCNSRAAHFNHQSKRAGSVNQAYSVSHLGTDLRSLTLSEYSRTRVKFLVEWFEVLRKMNKIADKDEKYPFVHVRTQFMEALRSDAKLSDAFTTLKHEDDKTKALQEMKDHMMSKAELYNGSDENAANTSTSWTVSALPHQVGIDDNGIYTLLVNKEKLDPSTRMPNNLFTIWSRDSK